MAVWGVEIISLIFFLLIHYLVVATVEGLSNGAVATDDGRCSDVGNDILQSLGGNAVDAAVAVTLCLGIVNPSGSTPGGGGVSTRSC